MIALSANAPGVNIEVENTKGRVIESPQGHFPAMAMPTLFRAPLPQRTGRWSSSSGVRGAIAGGGPGSPACDLPEARLISSDQRHGRCGGWGAHRVHIALGIDRRALRRAGCRVGRTTASAGGAWQPDRNKRDPVFKPSGSARMRSAKNFSPESS